MNKKLLCKIMIGVNTANACFHAYHGIYPAVVISIFFIGLFAYLH